MVFEKGYTPSFDPHQIQLDWIIKTVRTLDELVKQLIIITDNNYKEILELIKSLDTVYLKPDGNLTGSIAGYPVECVIQSIADSITLSKTLIDTVNHRESIGTVYDGGTFTDTDPIANEIDGGTFWNTKVDVTGVGKVSPTNGSISYEVNCIRPDYEVGGY